MIANDLYNSDGSSIPWSLAGDFNICLGPNETNSDSSVWSTGMLEFRDFLNVSGLTDLRATGNTFTWWDSSCFSPVLRKLDRVLVNDSWLSRYPLSLAHFRPRGLSDHNPALVDMGMNYAKIKKPFQFFLHFLEHPRFSLIVEEAWNAVIEGNPWFILTSKLKLIKDAFKNLNQDVGNLHEKVNEARESLLRYQNSLPNCPTPDQFFEEEHLVNSFSEALQQEEIFLKQKSRIQWLEKGDGNNKFFLQSCKGRWNQNKILSLFDDQDVEQTSHEGISKIAVDYFNALLGENKEVEPLPTDLLLPEISEHHKEMLVMQFTTEEVLQTFKSMANNKSPGPDGFPPEFFIKAWPIIGNEVSKAVLYFFSSMKMPRIINSTALALIPKQEHPSRITQFWPISCCNVLYKCIAKMLANRLKLVLPDIISPCQSAFVSNRTIGDNILLAQSLCRGYHLQSGPPRCAVKLDIHKAFDSLNWNFIFSALERMGFPTIFLKWLNICISTAMVSVKINGALEGFFQCKSGLRQGDPLSPALFVLAMEVFSALVRKYSTNPDFKYHWRASQVQLTHLIFADDVLLFSKGDKDSMKILLDTINHFSQISWLLPNASKSNCFFCNIPSDVAHDILQYSGYQLGTLPIKYLGLPLISKKLTTADCWPLVLRMCSKIDLWTSKFLKFSGRLQLIKVILFGIQSYWSMYLFLPTSVLKKLKSILAKFLWGGTNEKNCHYKVAWESCCLTKIEGGLGIRDPLEWNRAAIMVESNLRG